jgi:hypothetical protein
MNEKINLRNMIAASVLAAVGLGVPVTVAIQNAASQNNVSPVVASEEMRFAVIDAATTMKAMGLNKAEIENEVSSQIGVNKSEIQHLVNAVIARPQERADRSLFSVDLTVLFDKDNQQVPKQFAKGYCEALKKQSGADSALYTECVSDNEKIQSPNMCKGGVHVMYAPRLRATESMFERVRRNVGRHATLIVGDPAAYFAANGLSVCVDELQVP